MRRRFPTMTDDRSGSSTGSVWFIMLLVIGVAALLGIRSWLSGTGDPALASPSLGAPPDPNDVYDPVRAGEQLPSGYRRVLGRDQIFPIYEPAFVLATEVDWASDTLVIGVAGDKSAKAYPVTHLNRREMVIDSLEGIPILVTW